MEVKKESYYPYYDVARLEERNSQWLYKGRKIASKNKIKESLKENHDYELVGHPGIKETLSKIRVN